MGVYGGSEGKTVTGLYVGITGHIHIPGVFENRVLRRILGPKTDEATEEWRNYIMRILMICTAHPILFG